MLFRSNPSSAVPVYLQLIEQVKHGESIIIYQGDPQSVRHDLTGALETGFTARR